MTAATPEPYEMDPFRREQLENGAALGQDADLRALGLRFLVDASRHRYSYNFNWLGLPILQHPQDIVAMQEILWETRPDVVIETGVARGGSLIFYASMLELLGSGRVVGIDIQIRPENRKRVELHPLSKRITLVEGSSIHPEVVSRVRSGILPADKVMVCLDSNHTHEHVLRELELFAPLVTPGSHLVVFDTVIEDMPGEALAGRPWRCGNSPKSAVRAFLESTDEFEVRRDIDDKLVISAAPGGFLRRVRRPAPQA